MHFLNMACNQYIDYSHCDNKINEEILTGHKPRPRAVAEILRVTLFFSRTAVKVLELLVGLQLERQVPVIQKNGPFCDAIVAIAGLQNEGCCNSIQMSG